MEELSVGIQRIAESSSALWDTSQGTSEKAVHGNKIIEKAGLDMSQTNRTVGDTAAAMNKLREKSDQISGIVNVIRRSAENEYSFSECGN